MLKLWCSALHVGYHSGPTAWETLLCSAEAFVLSLALLKLSVGQSSCEPLKWGMLDQMLKRKVGPLRESNPKSNRRIFSYNVTPVTLVPLTAIKMLYLFYLQCFMMHPQNSDRFICFSFEQWNMKQRLDTRVVVWELFVPCVQYCRW